MENVFVNGGLTTYGESWQVVETRRFSDDEIASVRSNVVVNSQYGKSVCFFMESGGQVFIPMSNRSVEVKEGESIDIESAKLIKLRKTGEGQILRVEI